MHGCVNVRFRGVNLECRIFMEREIKTLEQTAFHCDLCTSKCAFRMGDVLSFYAVYGRISHRLDIHVMCSLCLPNLNQMA